MRITKSSPPEELETIGLVVHELTNGMPVTVRSKDKKGIRIENGRVIDREYTGPVLEEALEKGEVVRKVPSTGVYKGLPVVVVPIKEEGETIAAVGVVDVTFGVYSEINIIGRRRPAK
ncbi:MAG: DUF2111 domain-containing protein [Candidatus Verstraetearchaeota archaeon]|nr:DUF2111 domain-containing protein [Candidatus Verstraetearchaeota archaeon]